MLDVAKRLRCGAWGLGLFSVIGLSGCGDRGTSYELVDDGEALIAGAPYPTRDVAFVLVDIGGGVNRTPQQAMDALISSPNSLRNLLLYESYGRQDITGQVVSASYTMSGCNSTQPSQMAQFLRPQFAGYDHYIWYFGSRNTSCSWQSLGEIGTPNAPANDSWLNATTACLPLAQGFHHNLGEQHASSLRCGNAPFADDPNQQCTHGEYGDIFDTMGGACRQVTAWRKAHQEWVGGCNGVSVTASGTFTLLPYERRCDGTQFLKIKAPKSRIFSHSTPGGGATTEAFDSYYLELRTPLDFDGTLGGTALTPRVLVHVGGPLRTRSQVGVRTFLLDMAPSTTTFSDAALAQGQTFNDPAGGLSITAQSVSATQATIVVSSTASGAPTCLDGSTFTSPGPGPETCVDNPPTPVP
jgi:hypothetical protein